MAATTAVARETDEVRPKRPFIWSIRTKLALLAILAIPLVLVGVEAGRVLIGSNVHTVIPGKVYRSAQPSRKFLDWMIRTHGIKTVVNLRGTSPAEPWYQAESSSTSDLDLNQEDINFSAYRLPSSSELKQLVAVLDRVEYPILLHCRRGSDRTGLVTAAILLLEDGVSYGLAQGQLSLRFGHISLGRTAHLGMFLDFYHQWLDQQHLTHSPGLFRRWLLHEYRGGPCCSVIEKCELPAETVRVGQPFAVSVRVRNGGSVPWRLSPFPTAGAHLKFALFSETGIEPTAGGKTGYIDALVRPGESVDLTIPLPAVPLPGQYRLVLDMHDEQLGDFYQMGSEPLEVRLDVRE